MNDISGVGGTQPTASTGGSAKVTPPSKTTTQTHQKSSISPAEQEKHTKEPLMASPVLPPPLVSMSDMGNFIAIAGMAVAQAGQHAKPASTDDFVASVQLQMLQTTNTALAEWVKSIQDISAQNTKYLAEKRTNEIQSERTKDNLEAGQENADKARSVGEQTLIFSGLLMTGLVPGIASVSASTMVPITQAIAALAPAGVQALPAAFFTLAGVMASGAVMQASIQTLFSGAKDQKTIKSDFVKNYTARILSTINDPTFNSTLAKLFPNDTQLIPTAKLILLATALGLSYRAETGHMIGLDFLGLVNGSITLPAGDPRLGLIAAFQATLGEMKNQNQIKQRLSDYFDSQPSLDSLLEPADALAGLFAGQIVSPIISG